MGSKYASAFWRLFKNFCFFKVFYTVKILKYVTFLKHFTSFNSSNILLKQLIIKPFELLNIIPLTRTKTLVNNLLKSKF